MDYTTGDFAVVAEDHTRRASVRRGALARMRAYERRRDGGGL